MPATIHHYLMAIVTEKIVSVCSHVSHRPSCGWSVQSFNSFSPSVKFPLQLPSNIRLDPIMHQCLLYGQVTESMKTSCLSTLICIAFAAVPYANIKILCTYLPSLGYSMKAWWSCLICGGWETIPSRLININFSSAIARKTLTKRCDP